MLYVDGGVSTTARGQAADAGQGSVPARGRQPRRRHDRGAVAAGHVAEEVDWVVPHQANKRILDATAKKLGLDPARVVVTVDQHANTSAASVPLALDTAVKDGRIGRGDLIVLEAMGGGFTWGAAVVRY
jgi:3-oxoacyl-[acyl-carrier-protein] synthase-3